MTETFEISLVYGDISIFLFPLSRKRKIKKRYSDFYLKMIFLKRQKKKKKMFSTHKVVFTWKRVVEQLFVAK